MQREIISTPDAPAAVGPYSQAVRVGQLVFTAGQIALVPETGKLAGDDVETQTRQVMKNLSAVLAAAGSGLDRVVKTTIFVTDINDFALVNRVYGSFFSDNPPARSTVQVAALPLGAKVEIEAVALVDGAE
ncbi:MAG: RidA family protein [Chloroflexi bacterium]|nr:MAG: RidA family protein [Chloroflexota bacterium]